MIQLAVIILGLILFCLVMIFGAIRALNEQRDVLDDIMEILKTREGNLARELKHIRIENTRLRRMLGEFNDDEDIFPARQHNLNFKKTE